jgi:hypothetical protein
VPFEQFKGVFAEAAQYRSYRSYKTYGLIFTDLNLSFEI